MEIDFIQELKRRGFVTPKFNETSSLYCQTYILNRRIHPVTVTVADFFHFRNILPVFFIMTPTTTNPAFFAVSAA